MAARLASAAVGLPLLLLAVWTGGTWFSLLTAAAAGLGALELCAMARQKGHRPAEPLAAAWALALVLAAFFLSEGYPLHATVLPVLAGGCLALLCWLLWRPQAAAGLADWGLTAGSALYPGLLLLHAPLLRATDAGRDWVMFLLLATFATDTCAFFVGRTLGRRKLAPLVSPSKTWEGAAGGLLGAVASGAALFYALGLPVGLAQALALGALVGVAGQTGDLVESRLKRAAGVKESGWLVPGHGGILDRLDSILFSLVIGYYYVAWGVQ